MSSKPEQFYSQNVEKPQQVLDAERRAEELATSFVEQGMSIIQRLTEEVENAKLASRFNRDATVEDIRARAHGSEVLSYLARTKIEQEGEAGYKKAQLLSDLAQTQQALQELAEELKRIVVDFEASQLDDQK